MRVMVILRNLFILATVLFFGRFYYKMSISKSKEMKQYAFFMKMFFLVLSFILAFIEREFIIIGELSFGGRTSVMILIIIEIVDAFIDKRRE